MRGDDPGDLLGVVAELRWQVPVEPERGQPVHHRPGGDPVGDSLPADLPGAVEQGGRGCPGAPELGVVAADSSGRYITSKWARWVTAKRTYATPAFRNLPGVSWAPRRASASRR